MKSEKEKMLQGELYDCGDPELINRWHKAKELTNAYNNADTIDRSNMEAILDELLGSRGQNSWIAPPLFVDYGENIHLGENCEINMNCVFLDCAPIRLGNNVMIGPSVQLYAVTHPIKAQDRLPNTDGSGFAFCKANTAPITIGDNSWIGGGSIILPGVTIGKNVTIGAGSVVTRSIPDNTLAVGNPCKAVKSLL